MSDLEQAALRVPMITSAVGKLRSIAGNTSNFGEADGLVDAFAEVFAQMAIATPPPVQTTEPATNPNDNAAQEVPQAAKSNDGEQSDDREATDTSQTNVLAVDQPLVAEPQADGSVEVDPLGTEQQAVQEQSAELVNQDSELPPDAETRIADIQAPEEAALETEVESDRVADSQIAAAVDLKPQQRDRREQDSDAANESVQAPTQQTKGDTPAKSSDAPSDHRPQDQKKEQVQTQHHPPTAPAQRTTRQKFLDQRRTENRSSEGASKQAPDNHASAVAEPAADSQILPEAVPSSPSTKAPSAVSSSVAAQSIVDPKGSATNSVAKASVKPVGARGESRTGAQSVQNETGNRIDHGSGPETRPSKTDASSTAARIKLVQRVSRAFQHLGPEGGMVRLRLAPAELGSVRVEMQISQRKVQARVVAETEAASAALREHLPELRARLESYGMQVERLDVETESSDPQSGLPFDREPQRRESEQRQPRQHRSQEASQIKNDLSPRRVNQTRSSQSALASPGVDLRV